MIAAALAAQRRFEDLRRDDQFAELRIDRSIVGRRVRIVGRFGDGNRMGGSGQAGYYTYSNGALRLIFSPREAWTASGSPRRLIGVMVERTRSGGGYVGSNAYGARAAVTVEWREEDALAFIERPAGRTSPYAQESPPVPANLRRFAPADPLDDYWFDASLPPSEARLLATNARLIIEGVVRPIAGDTLAECHGTYGRPTVDDPREIFISTCWLGASIDRVAIVDGRSQAVLQEWRR